ncbi:YggT family protein [Brevibacillus choshinensis]|uniref:YggT family protein n=1 Tax=Brevibacillus choshinensis TaxID=54911 RepID=A0ABX7FHX4_BRECH|nr:YggT family protein [Brevibacillus choshinensis]QRG65747.1 YggT family protein [Brevibacillus choshinensis]
MGYLLTILDFLITVYRYMIIAYILMSWVPQMRETGIGQLLERLVEPYLAPFRRFIPTLGFIDISPIVALIVLQLAYSGLLSILSKLL